ncbi:NAD(P)/FAD-dependent oxidoreductase [Tenacibaculum sp. Bg11-29]|nr:NAD(P)/FAD-dependent oxidoreductase [Tenacibaculum sp. Bg11-29]
MKRRKFIKINSQFAILFSLIPTTAIESCSQNKKNMTKNKNLDVLVVGGGPAGMNAALVFGRALMNTVIVNEEKPRNLVTQASHGFLTRDGFHPSEFLQVAKKQLEQYVTVNYKMDVVKQVDKTEIGFKVKTNDGTEYQTKRIVFATGYKDDLSKLGLIGIEKVYGKTVFPCPFCDGWERRNEPLALFGKDEGVGHFAKTISNWTDDLIIFTNGKKPIRNEEKENLKKNNIKVVEQEILKLISENGNLKEIKLADGNSIKRTGGFLFSTGEKQSTDIPAKLGVEFGDWGGTYLTNEWGKSKVDGVYIVGDAKNNFTGVIGSASEGSYVAEMITQEIIGERWVS